MDQRLQQFAGRRRVDDAQDKVPSEIYPVTAKNRSLYIAVVNYWSSQFQAAGGKVATIV